ncbi:MAG: hypothetical protein LIR46_08105 [Bacteroidota bacterium]|nr:hypothetical protein [Bacteroidota bacterium]
MTREEAIEIIINDVNTHTIREGIALNMAIKALEQEATTKKNLGVDCISREQAKEAIRDKFKDLPSRVEINTILNELPSITRQEPVIDKIRAEIVEEILSHSGTGEETIQAYADGLKKGLDILDKYKAKSEDRE